ncbi:sulfatase family protein [Haloarcula nitratireducens]|uniref:Sulfatase-like hydrolase/transferase n=1 Tax=Haloarcula nitratireducens TaxID=2487749 RepID=A0AAW4P7V3_9EURY|nr:sulfatase [Halomicroarcula nitratireducens]MBX0294015.1 sulfatase-like hydrolase/transferase [Halomicroarcula nitratireducens]
MNVIVVVIDALRSSDVGCLGRKDDTTPNIDRLAEESLVFEHAFSMSNYTDVCMSNILSGKMPREHGVTHHGTAHTKANLRRIEERSPTFLPELLQENGYETIGVDWMGRWHEWGYDTYGLDNDDGNDEQSAPEAVVNRIKDIVIELPEPLLAPIMKQYYRWMGYNDFRVNCEELTDIALDRIQDADNPFFTLLHYWDVHPPYLPPDEYKQFSYEGEDEPLSKYFGSDAKGPLAAEYQPYARGERTTIADSKEAYDGAISWVDEQFGRLLAHLREQEILDETMVVVTADHGHNFGEHGIFSDNCGLYDTSIHVPLIVHDPRREHQRIKGIVQHADIVPTICEFADIEVPDDLRGNILPATRQYAFAETIGQRMQMVRTDRWKLIVPNDITYLQEQYWYNGDGSVELYDLETDPTESEDISDDHPEIVERLRGTLEEELETQEQIAKAGAGRSAEINDESMDEIKSQLSALGYADDDNV